MPDRIITLSVSRDIPNGSKNVMTLGLKVNAWTVNKPEEYENGASKRNIDFITTNEPIQLQEEGEKISD